MRIWHIILCVSAALLSGCPALSGEDWDYSLGGHPRQAVVTGLEFTGDGAIFTGLQSSGSDYSYAYVAKVNNSGRLLRKDYVDEVYMSSAGALCMVQSGGASIIGGGTHVRQSGTRGDMLIAAVDAEGTQLWSRRFGAERRKEVVTDMALEAGGGVVFVGFSDDEEEDKSLFGRISANGEMLEWRNLEYDGVTLRGITGAPNGEFVAVGALNEGAGAQGMLFRLTNTGDHIASVGLSEAGLSLSDLAILSDGRYAFAGRGADGFVYGVFNSSLALDWIRTVSGSEGTGALAVAADLGGSFLVAGRRNNNAFVIRSSGDGAEILRGEFPAEGEDLFSCIASTPGGFVAGGYYTTPTLGNIARVAARRFGF